MDRLVGSRLVRCFCIVDLLLVNMYVIDSWKWNQTSLGVMPLICLFPQSISVRRLMVIRIAVVSRSIRLELEWPAIGHLAVFILSSRACRGISHRAKGLDAVGRTVRKILRLRCAPLRMTMGLRAGAI